MISVNDYCITSPNKRLLNIITKLVLKVISMEILECEHINH